MRAGRPRAARGGGGAERVGAARPQVRYVCLSRSFDGDDFDDVEEDEGLEDLENAEEVRAPWTAGLAGLGRLCLSGGLLWLGRPQWLPPDLRASVAGAAEQRRGSVSTRRDRRTWRFCPRESDSRQTRSGSRPPT